MRQMSNRRRAAPGGAAGANPTGPFFHGGGTGAPAADGGKVPANAAAPANAAEASAGTSASDGGLPGRVRRRGEQAGMAPADRRQQRRGGGGGGGGALGGGGTGGRRWWRAGRRGWTGGRRRRRGMPGGAAATATATAAAAAAVAPRAALALAAAAVLLLLLLLLLGGGDGVGLSLGPAAAGRIGGSPGRVFRDVAAGSAPPAESGPGAGASAGGGGQGGGPARGAAPDPPGRGRGEFRTRLDGAPPCTALASSDVTYTLVTQLSEDRLWMMGQHCRRWGTGAPISAVVYTDRSPRDVEDRMVRDGCARDQLAVGTVATAGYAPTEYPVNRMRNLALSQVGTTHVMYVDVDFWESTHLHDVLTSENVREEMAADPRLAAVVPAFEILRQCREYRDCRDENLAVMPNTTQQMMDLVVNATAGAFDPTNRGGHGSTSYGAWYRQEEGQMYDIPCFKSNRYEPYLAFRYCDALPPFQEQFTGYGKNKMTWVMQLRRAGYDFAQLGQIFLVHYPHLDSKSRLEWNNGPGEVEAQPVVDEKDGNVRRRFPGKMVDGDGVGVDYNSFKRGKVDQIYVAFRDWLATEVPDQTKVHPCDDATDDDSMLWVNKG